MTGAVEQAREAFARAAWGEAFRSFAGADHLSADDLERLAVAAHLVGRDRESADAWEGAYRAHIADGGRERAARCAFWLGFGLALRGDGAQANGWLGRAAGLVEELDRATSVHGLLLVMAFLEANGGGDHERAYELATEMVRIGKEYGDADLLAIGVLTRGEAMLALGDVAQGMRAFDEAMVAVTSGDVSPTAAGIVYCAVIDACVRASDLRRAAEWTDALERWCSSQPDLVPYRGQCLVHRSQTLQARGSWTKAKVAVDEACRRLADPPHPALGYALYQQAELHRLRGEFAEAEKAYRAASERGHDPAVGLARLRLADGKIATAVGAARRMLEERTPRLDRAAIVAVAVDVFLADNDLERARVAANELDSIAAMRDVPLIQAMAGYASGSVLVAAGDAGAALPRLRLACSVARDLGMPYETARARVQLALACRALGDDDATAFELDAARAAFEELGALPDLVSIERLMAPAPPAAAAATALTTRECEVLRLVAKGRTNKEIAAELVISEHTVARHLQNIFLKLDLPSRAAATAYAYEHGVV